MRQFPNGVLRIVRLVRPMVWLLAAFLGLLPAAGSLADTSGQMNTYWSGALGEGSVTGPSAYSGQTMRYYSGGSLTMRTPQQNLQLFSVQPPGLKAGCGGIDIFAGGFSFVNSAELVAFMKAVAANAEGYAFNAALGYLCPTCQKWLNDLQHMAQEINSTNISSCQAAQALVNTTFDALEANAHNLCSELGTSDGTFSDMVQGWAKCESNAVGNLSSSSSSQYNPTSLNLAWQAIKKNSLLASDQAFAQEVMTITGTVIVNCSGDSSGQCTISNIPPSGDQKTLIQAMLDGGSAQSLSCDDYDVCLNPTAGSSVNITSGFKVQVENLLDDMVSKIVARRPLTSAEINLVNASPLPILKMAHVYATAQGVLAQQAMDNYAELIATSLVISFIQDTVQQVRMSAQNLPNTNKDQVAAWDKDVSDLDTRLKSFEQTAAVQETAYEQIVTNTRAVEQDLSGNYSNLFAQSNAFNPATATR